MVMKLCGCKLGLVVAIAGKLTLRMRFELWCLPSLVHWRAVRKHFMLWWGKFFVLPAVLSLLKLQSRETAWTLLQNTLAGSHMWGLKFLRWWVCGMFVFWDVMRRIFERNKLPPSCCYKMVVSRWRQQVPPTCRFLSAKQQGITSHNTVLSLKFVTPYVMLTMFLNVRFVLSDFHPLLTFLSIQHRILNCGTAELLTDRGKDNKYFPSWAGC